MIKLANEQDLDEIEPMLERLDAFHIEHLPDRFKPRFAADRVAFLKKIMAADGAVLFIKDVAFVTVEQLGHERFRIEHLFVEKSFRRKGLGLKLVREVERRFKGEIFVSVHAFNSDAIAFYDRIFSRSTIVFRTVTKALGK